MAVAHVQTVKFVDNSAAGTLTSGAIVTSAGSLLLVSCLEFGAFGSALALPTSMKVDNTSAMTQDITFEANTSSNFRMRVTLYSFPNISAASHSVTRVESGNIANNILWFLTEVSGALATAAVDGSGGSGSGVGTASTTGAMSSTNANDFWLCATTSIAANPATFTAGGGWTIPTNGTETNSSSNLCGGVEYMANPGATTETGTFTLKTSDWVTAGIAYKAAAGGGSTLVVPRGVTIGSGVYV